MKTMIKKNHDCSLLIPLRNTKYVSLVVPGKIMNVTMKTNINAIKNFHPTKKLFLSNIKKAVNDD